MNIFIPYWLIGITVLVIIIAIALIWLMLDAFDS